MTGPRGEWYQVGRPATEPELAATDGATLIGYDNGGRGAAATVGALASDVLVDTDLAVVDVVTGAEGAIVANAFDIACQVRDVFGGAVSGAREVTIETIAVTDGQGDIAAAGTPVGTLHKANNPATGPNTATMTTSAAGAFSFRVTDTAAEACHVRIQAEGCRPKVVKLTFA
jgi:hypothetical protein